MYSCVRALIPLIDRIYVHAWVRLCSEERLINPSMQSEPGLDPNWSVRWSASISRSTTARSTAGSVWSEVHKRKGKYQYREMNGLCWRSRSVWIIAKGSPKFKWLPRRLISTLCLIRNHQQQNCMWNWSTGSNLKMLTIPYVDSLYLYSSRFGWLKRGPRSTQDGRISLFLVCVDIRKSNKDRQIMKFYICRLIFIDILLHAVSEDLVSSIVVWHGLIWLLMKSDSGVCMFFLAQLQRPKGRSQHVIFKSRSDVLKRSFFI